MNNDDLIIFDRIKRQLEWKYDLVSFDIDDLYLDFGFFEVKIINNNIQIINYDLEESEKLLLLNNIMRLYDNVSIKRGWNGRKSN